MYVSHSTHLHTTPPTHLYKLHFPQIRTIPISHPFYMAQFPLICMCYAFYLSICICHTFAHFYMARLPPICICYTPPSRLYTNVSTYTSQHPGIYWLLFGSNCTRLPPIFRESSQLRAKNYSFHFQLIYEATRIPVSIRELPALPSTE